MSGVGKAHDLDRDQGQDAGREVEHEPAEGRQHQNETEADTGRGPAEALAPDRYSEFLRTCVRRLRQGGEQTRVDRSGALSVQRDGQCGREGDGLGK